MRVPLVSGAYQARSIIAGAQRCVNLYPESNPSDSQAPVPVVHYPTPGLVILAEPPVGATSVMRCSFRSSKGELFVVIGPNVYYVDASYVYTLLGTIVANTTPVSMQDNGLCIVIVDGTTSGSVIDMATHAYGAISATNFYGADKVDFVDTYFIFNRPNTAQFYISLSNVTSAMLIAGTAFDPLDIAAKSGSPDDIASLIVVHREVWLVGKLTTEVWFNSGAADFTFQALPGAFIEHGCIAKYSLAKQDLSVFWLTQDREGKCIIVRGTGYAVNRVSTHAIEALISKYSDVTDAIGYCYQQEGHAFYCITFPTADKTWAYELMTGQWHELAWTDGNGILHRHRANCASFAYGNNLVGDWQNGRLYKLDPEIFTDFDGPIVRIRSFPHIVDDGQLLVHTSFMLDIQVGTLEETTTDDPPMVSLRWSDTKGASFGNPVMRSIGSAGQYKTRATWNNLGMAADRIYELSWSVPVKTALNGCFLMLQKTQGA